MRKKIVTLLAAAILFCSSLNSRCSKPSNCFEIPDFWTKALCVWIQIEPARAAASSCPEGCERATCSPGGVFLWPSSNSPSCVRAAGPGCVTCGGATGMQVAPIVYTAVGVADQSPSNVVSVVPSGVLLPDQSVVLKFSESMDPATLSFDGDLAGELAQWDSGFTNGERENDTLTIRPVSTWTLGWHRSLAVRVKEMAGNETHVELTYAVRDSNMEEALASAAITAKAAQMGFYEPQGMTRIAGSADFHQVYLNGGAHAAVYYSASRSGAFEVHGGIYVRYYWFANPPAWNGHFNSLLGLPVSDEYACGFAMLGRCSNFERGMIVWPGAPFSGGDVILY